MVEIFSIITMITRTGKKLYLKSGETTNQCEWTFDRKDAIWFETNHDAELFSKHYFKNFKNYNIEDIKCYI